MLVELKSLGLTDKLEGFCFHTSPGLDHHYLMKIFNEVGIPLNQVIKPIFNFEKALIQLSQYNLVITTRFHAAVAASSFTIPFIAVSSGAYYQNKMNSVVQGQGFGISIDLQKSDPKVIAREIVTAFQKR